MNMDKINSVLEAKVMPLANKMSGQRHLRAIRDAFVSILPITLVGGIASVLSAAPVTDTTTNGFLLAWAAFAEKNSLLLSWVNAVTMGSMALYICIGIVHFLCKHYKMDSFMPCLLAVGSFIMLVVDPLELSFAGKTAEISYMDGKGLLPAILIAIFTAEAYTYMRKHNWGRIKLPDSVPAALSETFASLVPGTVLLLISSVLFAILKACGTTLPGLIYQIVSPAFEASDSLGFTIIVTLLLHVFWFFGIHDAAFGGISEPIIFGVPLMLNPVFFIPFLMTSTVNGIISFLLVSGGVIGKSFAMLSWNMPSVFGAFLSTMDIKAAILIIVLVILDMVIYFPFFKIYEKSLVKMETGEEE